MQSAWAWLQGATELASTYNGKSGLSSGRVAVGRGDQPGGLGPELWHPKPRVASAADLQTLARGMSSLASGDGRTLSSLDLMETGEVQVATPGSCHQAEACCLWPLLHNELLSS